MYYNRHFRPTGGAARHLFVAGHKPNLPPHSFAYSSSPCPIMGLSSGLNAPHAPIWCRRYRLEIQKRHRRESQSTHAGRAKAAVNRARINASSVIYISKTWQVEADVASHSGFHRASRSSHQLRGCRRHHRRGIPTSTQSRPKRCSWAGVLVAKGAGTTARKTFPPAEASLRGWRAASPATGTWTPWLLCRHPTTSITWPSAASPGS